MNKLFDKSITINAALLAALLLAISANSHADQNCAATLAAAASSGVRNSDSIRCVFVTNRHNLNVIYNEERKNTPTLEGDIEIKLALTPAGTVDASSSIGNTTTSNPAFEQKILTAVKGFNFGTAKDSFQTSYTLRFYSD